MEKLEETNNIIKQEWIKWGEPGSHDITYLSLVRFDTGEICMYRDDWPFGELTHVFIVPEPNI